MATQELTDKAKWAFSNGFYGFWWNLPPYNTKEYQEAFEECMRNYEAVSNWYTWHA